jgi:hypothetical protein
VDPDLVTMKVSAVVPEFPSPTEASPIERRGLSSPLGENS